MKRNMSTTEDAFYEFMCASVDFHDGVRWLDENGTVKDALSAVMHETESAFLFVACVRSLATLVVGGREIVESSEFEGWKGRATQTVLKQIGDADDG